MQRLFFLQVVDLLDVPVHCLQTPLSELNTDELGFVKLAKAAAMALWSLSTSQKNKEVMRKCGIIFLLAKLLRSIHLDVVIPTVAIIMVSINFYQATHHTSI